jgi:NADH dehydrogenase
MKLDTRTFIAGGLLAGAAGMLIAGTRSRKSPARLNTNEDARGGSRPRILVLGGGFGGAYTARHLERLLGPDEAEIVLISRHNYFMMTPLLFEVGAGVLDARAIANPIRSILRSTRFVEGSVERIDAEQKVVTVRRSLGDVSAYPYDQLVLGLGGSVNLSFLPGAAEHALTYSSIVDAFLLRNMVSLLFEMADAETDPARRAALLRFVIIGGGHVGVELMGELSEFVHRVARSFPRLRAEEIGFDLIQSGPRIMPEMSEPLAAYAAAALERRGVRIRTHTRVARIEKGRVHLPDGETIAATTIIASTGVTPSPVLADLPLAKDPRGRVVTDATMRSTSHPEVWALGDNAAIPSPDGKTYPPLAQHAVRQARVLADNIAAALRGSAALQPFRYESQGTLATLGQRDGVAVLRGLPVRGLPAWVIWRAYYMLQTPELYRRLRILIDRTLALFFKPDIINFDLSGEERALRWVAEQTGLPIETAAVAGTTRSAEIPSTAPRDGLPLPAPAARLETAPRG